MIKGWLLIAVAFIPLSAALGQEGGEIEVRAIS
jgi:hypothetical protein